MDSKLFDASSKTAQESKKRPCSTGSNMSQNSVAEKMSTASSSLLPASAIKKEVTDDTDLPPTIASPSLLPASVIKKEVTDDTDDLPDYPQLKREDTVTGDLLQTLEIKEPTPASNEMTAPSMKYEERFDLPTTWTDFSRFTFHYRQSGKEPFHLVAFATVRMVRLKTGVEDALPDAEEAVYNLLVCIERLATSQSITAGIEKQEKIRSLLETVMGDNTATNGPYAYPLALQIKAAATLETVNERLLLAPGTSRQANNSAEGTQRGHKRHDTGIRQLDLTHAPQNVRDAMRGILIYTQGRRKLSRTYNVRSCKVFGHNGIPVGKWWPYRICALRDGAHGAMIAGVSGSIDDGAWSIVVSDAYTDFDRDNGDKLEYSGTRAHDNEDPKEPIISYSTAALQKSIKTGKPVRVLRAAGGDSRYSPTIGIRYDGLYSVTGEAQPLNKKGGRYVRFTLVRNAGQADIDRTRPNQVERGIFTRLRDWR